MASEREIEQIRKDTDQWRRLVHRLLQHDEGVVQEKDLHLLDSLSTRLRQEELSYRQAEWLLDIRDAVETVSAYRGYSIHTLGKRCWENHLDLDEDDEVWVESLIKSGRSSVRRHEAKRLYGLARRLGEVDDWAA